MRKLLPLLFFLPSFFLSPHSQAQSTDWTPIFLTASGNHIVSGVEAYYQRATCGSDEVVFIKFVNTNDYAVDLEWHNAVFTQDIQWIHHWNEVITLTVPSASNQTGDCEGEAILTVNLSDFISDPAQFKRFCTSQLSINKSNN